MRPILLLAAITLLAGCGADTMSAAATAAAVKKQEVEQGKKTMDHFRQRLDAATAQMQQSADRTAAAADGN